MAIDPALRHRSRSRARRRSGRARRPSRRSSARSPRAGRTSGADFAAALNEAARLDAWRRQHARAPGRRQAGREREGRQGRGAIRGGAAEQFRQRNVAQGRAGGVRAGDSRGHVAIDACPRRLSDEIAKSGALGISRRLFERPSDLRRVVADPCGAKRRQRPSRRRRDERQRSFACRAAPRSPTAPICSRAVSRYERSCGPRQRRGAEERALAMILPVVERLRLAVEAENLRAHAARAGRLSGNHSQRKSQGLLELSRLPARAAAGRDSTRARVRLRRSLGQAGRQQAAAAYAVARGADDVEHRRARDPRRSVGRHLFRSSLAGRGAMIKTLFVGGLGLPDHAGGELRRRRVSACARRSRRPRPRLPRSETRKTKEINMPIIRDGAVKGYVVTQLSYVVDVAVAKKLPVAARRLRRRRGVPLYLRRRQDRFRASRQAGARQDDAQL